MLYRYRAIPLRGGGPRSTRGVLAAESAAEARASLRRVGLLAIDVKQASRAGGRASRLAPILRSRRLAPKADLLDALATLLDAGISLEESMGTLGNGHRQVRALVGALRHEVREGSSLSAAMQRRPSWFDAADVSLVRCGELSGELPSALRAACDRYARIESVESKFVQAITYPSIVAAMAVGVTVFLSTSTLPQLSSILIDADVPVPTLTSAVMRAGSLIASYGPAAVATGLLLVLVLFFGRARPDRGSAAGSIAHPHPARRVRARLARRCLKAPREGCLADALLSVAHLARVGVPLVEALRAASASLRGVCAPRVASGMRQAAVMIESGHPAAHALGACGVVDAELIGLISAGEAAGELHDVLTKAGHRLARRSQRATQRLAALLEPGAILFLAVLVGVVVMAAVLPLVKLKEIV